MIQEKLKRLFDYDDTYIEYSDICNDIMMKAAEDDNPHSILLAQSIATAIEAYADIKDKIFVSKDISNGIEAVVRAHELKIFERAIVDGLLVMYMPEEDDE